MRKQIKQLRKWASERGWNAEVTGGTHLRWTNPKVSKCVFSSLTPSCPFAWKKIKSDLLKFEKQYAI